MSWSPQQEAALKAIAEWLKDPRRKQVFRLFGYAGTGKSTIARELQNMVDGKVLFAAFTGKAALVMRSKGCGEASTLHSLIYKADEDSTGQPVFTLNRSSDLRSAALLVIDEVSMVGSELGQDVLSFGVPVLVLGDPFQLPPVNDAGFFTEHEPDFMLTEIHRQAQDNPIIRLSMDVREGQRLEYGQFGETKIIPRSKVGQKMILGSDQVLCGLNRTRRGVNEKVRTLLGFNGAFPVSGDKLVCLRNNREKGLLNGSLWTVNEATRKKMIVSMRLVPEGQKDKAPIEVETHEAFFLGKEGELDKWTRRSSDEFDYGYALTVHKSQGSQWNNVVLFDESASFREHAARHLYTGITRGAERLTLVI